MNSAIKKTLMQALSMIRKILLPKLNQEELKYLMEGKYYIFKQCYLEDNYFLVLGVVWKSDILSYLNVS